MFHQATAEIVRALVKAGYKAECRPPATEKPAPTHRVYIYNENCIQAGQSVPQRIIEEHPDPANGGDWTMYEGTEVELMEIARELYQRGPTFNRKVARTIAGMFFVDLDADEE